MICIRNRYLFAHPYLIMQCSEKLSISTLHLWYYIQDGTVRFKVLQEYEMIIAFTIALILDKYIVSLKEFKVVQIYQVTKTQNELKICKL